MPQEPVIVKTNEVAIFKLKFKNTGMNNWPVTTNLYEIAYSKYSAFNDQKNFVKAGDCKANFYKFLELQVCAPRVPGRFTYTFRFGSDGIDSLFGAEAKINLTVEEEEFEEPPVDDYRRDDIEG